MLCIKVLQTVVYFNELVIFVVSQMKVLNQIWKRMLGFLWNICLFSPPPVCIDPKAIVTRARKRAG